MRKAKGSPEEWGPVSMRSFDFAQDDTGGERLRLEDWEPVSMRSFDFAQDDTAEAKGSPEKWEPVARDRSTTVEMTLSGYLGVLG